MKQAEATKINRKLADITGKMPTLSDFLDQAADISPLMAQTVAGIWCGREGTERIYIEEGLEFRFSRMLVVGWYNGKAEYAYVS